MACLTPNFNFAGQCEEAMNLYQKAFGATVGCLLRYSDANKSDFDQELSADRLRWIYHAEMTIAGQRVMLCDNMNVAFQPGLSLSLVVTLDTKEDVMTAYDALKDGCTLIYAPRSTTYSSCEVVLIDRFGFRWGIMTEQTER